jgi:eukaryotic-like serine/threonine-protein kinase
MTDLRDQVQQDLGSAYTLEQELGGGGMSRVFLAKDNSLGRQVVIKILPPEMAAAVSSQRFRREIQLAANLQHPHIVPLLSAGEINGLPYFTMPYVRGESLRAHLTKVGELPLSEAIRILREVASALSYAHENSVVHRDIKPENVLISGGSAVVTDFGVAKALSASTEAGGSSLTSMGVALGTPAYMAPEQATADPHTDHRADIYALGVMAYEMITGSTPFPGRSPQATLAAHVTELPESVARRRSNLPLGLAAIVMRCLQKRPADRQQSAQDVMHELDALTTPSGGTTPTASFHVVRSRRWMIPAVAVLAIVTAGGVAYRSLGSRGNVAGIPAAVAANSIAVLPFTNMSGDVSNEYFSDGLAEELLNQLAQIPGLRVAARTSSFQFKGKTTDIREVGSKLGVLTVLEGSVRKSGERMRITAQLIDAKTGYNLWSETFDRTVTDVFAVQDEITRAISQALRVRLGTDQTTQMAMARPENEKAHDAYLKGMFVSNVRTDKGLREAIEHFKTAISIDPNYAAAHAELGRTYTNMASLGYLPAAEALTIAKVSIDRALKIDPNSPQIQVNYASWLNVKGELDEAEQVLRAAIQKNPNLAKAHQSYSVLLRYRGRAQEGLKEALITRELDPLSTSAAISVGIAQAFAGNRKEAIQTYRDILQQSPDNSTGLYYLATLLADDGQYAEAIAVGEKAVVIEPEDPYSKLTLAYVYGKAGQHRDKALEMLRKIEASPDASQLRFEIAGGYAALGEKELGFASLEKAPDASGIFVKLDPSLDPFRGDPRFARLLNKWGVK